MGAAVVVSFVTFFQARYGLRTGKINVIGVVVAGLLGLIMGEILDYVVGYRMGVWGYTRHPYWTLSYWLVLPLMWSEFGVSVYAACRAVKHWYIIIPIMMVAYEGYGIIRHSWNYAVDPWIVILGWIPLIAVIYFATDWVTAWLNWRREAVNVER